MELTLLKNRIKKNHSILKITNSLKVMSMTRLKHLKQNKDNLIKYCQDIKNNILKKYNEETFIEKKKIIENETSIYINIFLFSDMSFCGTLNKQNENFIKKIQENFFNENNIFSFIIGFKGEKYHNTKYNLEYLCKIYDKNLNKILNSKIQNIINNNSMDNLIIRIFSYEKDPIEIHYIHGNINNEKNIIYKEFYSKYLLNSHILNYKYEECKTRLIKVTTAIKNSEELNNTLKILYNKKRQEIITKDLLEVISGSQVDLIE